MFSLSRVFAKRSRAQSHAADCDLGTVPVQQISFGAAMNISKMQRKLLRRPESEAEAAPPPRVDVMAVEAKVHHFAHSMRRTTTYRNKQKREAEEVRMPRDPPSPPTRTPTRACH
jgi:hypothetical protein